MLALAILGTTVRHQADLSVEPVPFTAIAADFVDVLKFGNLLLSDVL